MDAGARTSGKARLGGHGCPFCVIGQTPPPHPQGHDSPKWEEILRWLWKRTCVVPVLGCPCEHRHPL